MFAFLTDRLARISGTRRTETSIALRMDVPQHELATDSTSRVERGEAIAGVLRC